jgi:hypothetical protein
MQNDYQNSTKENKKISLQEALVKWWKNQQ